jgi:hypothetical protein
MRLMFFLSLLLSLMLGSMWAAPAKPKIDVRALKEPPPAPPHGEVRDGVSLGIWSEKDRYSLGSPMNVWIILNYQRKDANGHRVPYPKGFFDHSYLFITLPSGKVTTRRLIEPPDRIEGYGFMGGISEMLQGIIDSPGVYKLQWKIDKLESNEVQLTVDAPVRKN